MSRKRSCTASSGVDSEEDWIMGIFEGVRRFFGIRSKFEREHTREQMVSICRTAKRLGQLFALEARGVDTKRYLEKDK